MPPVSRVIVNRTGDGPHPVWNLIILAGVAGIAPIWAEADRGAVRPPNVVFILADDLGWMDLSIQGSRYYQTPNIDALMQRGMRFTNYYAANPLSSPTRASILTGLFPGHLSVGRGGEPW